MPVEAAPGALHFLLGATFLAHGELLEDFLSSYLSAFQAAFGQLRS